MTTPCIQHDRIDKHERHLARFRIVRHGVFEYLVISAAISTLILVWHMTRSLQHMDVALTRVHDVTTYQNKLLEQINETLKQNNRKGPAK